MCVRCFGGLSRRGVMTGLAGLAVAGCSENPASGRRQLAFVSDDQLKGLADQSWREILAQAPVSRDPELNARLLRVAEPLARATGRSDLDWEFVVFDSDQQNAFVLPNGKVGFFRGLLELAGDDDEVGAVMGHEAAHVVARHAAERVSQQLALRAGVTLATLLFSGENGENADLIAGALGLGATYGVMLPFSRSHELEADRLGVDLMRQVGLDPRGAVRFWARMAARQSSQGQVIEALSTHPADARRLEALQASVEAA